jgi:hypothetical protein
VEELSCLAGRRGVEAMLFSCYPVRRHGSPKPIHSSYFVKVASCTHLYLSKTSGGLIRLLLCLLSLYVAHHQYSFVDSPGFGQVILRSNDSKNGSLYMLSYTFIFFLQGLFDSGLAVLPLATVPVVMSSRLCHCIVVRGYIYTTNCSMPTPR